jgi:ABC-type iron transport system FetAB permease component
VIYILILVVSLIIVGFVCAYVLEEKGTLAYLSACGAVTLAVGLTAYLETDESIDVRLRVAFMLSIGSALALFVPIFVSERMKPPRPFVGIAVGTFLTLVVWVGVLVIYTWLWMTWEFST